MFLLSVTGYGFAAEHAEAAQEEVVSGAAEIIDEVVDVEDAEARALAAAESEEINKEGTVLLKNQDTEGAIAAFQRAIDRDPANEAAYRNLGSAYSWTGDQDKAIEIFEKLVSVAPDDAYGYRHLVLIYNIQGLYKKAIAAGEEALRINPDDFGVIGYMAHDYVAVGLYEEAVSYCERLIEKNPDNNKPYRMLAKVYAGLDRTDEAEDMFRKSYNIVRKESADKTAPEKKYSVKDLFRKMRAEVLFVKGNRYIEDGDQTKSIESYNKSIKLNPNDFRVYYNLARIYETIKEADLAIENIGKSVRLNPGLLQQIVNSPDFSGLKDTEGFKKLLEEEEKEKSEAAALEEIKEE